MQVPSNKSNISAPSTPPLVVLDAAVLSSVAGGLGPHGGWAVPPAAAGHLRAAPLSGPHGGWIVQPLGPHGGW